MSEQNVQVTRADREAAVGLLWELHPEASWNGSDEEIESRRLIERIAIGENDDHSVVQAFARHRTRAEPDLVEAAKRVLEWWPEGSEETSLAGKSKGGTFAADIQALRVALTRADV